GMNQKGASANGLRSCQRTAQGVTEEGFTVALSLFAAVYCKARHEITRHRITSLPFHDARGGVLQRKRRWRKAGVTPPALAACQDIGSGSPARLILQSILREKVVERRLAAVKTRDLMAFGKQDRRVYRLIGH